MESPPSPRPPTEELALAQEVSRLILAIAGRLQDNYATCAAEFGLTGAQAKLLMALAPGEALPMRVLAERLRYDPSNLTGLVDKLASRGIVMRRPDHVDRRVKALVLTAQGERLRSTFLGRLVRDAGPLARLSRSQLVGLRDGLSAVVAPERPVADAAVAAPVPTAGRKAASTVVVDPGHRGTI